MHASELPHMEWILKDIPLFFETYSPGDGVTRYRFFSKPSDYFSGSAIKTVLGRTRALEFADAFIFGYNAANGYCK